MVEKSAGMLNFYFFIVFFPPALTTERFSSLAIFISSLCCLLTHVFMVDPSHPVLSQLLPEGTMGDGAGCR